MLLLLAEAEVEAGSLENARTIVNEIRTRAGVKAQGPGTDRASIAVPINDPTITWAKYQICLYTTPFASQADARTKVRAERRLELAMEGQRFFDLQALGNHRCDAECVRSGGEDPTAVSQRCRSVHSAASLLPDPCDSDRVEQDQRKVDAHAEHRLVTSGW